MRKLCAYCNQIPVRQKRNRYCSRYCGNEAQAACRKIDGGGYVLIRMPEHPHADERGYVCEHRVVAEKALGRILSLDSPVHHINGNKLDNSPSNLLICESQSYHRILHVRERIVHAGGHPDIHKICTTCKRLLERREFPRDRARNDGLNARCFECSREHERIRWARRRDLAVNGMGHYVMRED